MARRKFILFELNEVPLRVVRHFADKRPGSAFARLLREGPHWETSSPDSGHLSPWITWPTVHRGVSNLRHHLSALGQDTEDADRDFPPVWKILARAGRKVGLFGSLHSYPLPPDAAGYAFYVPDTFAAGPETHPRALSVFQQFNLTMVDRSGRNVGRGVPARQALEFLKDAVGLGLRPGTMARIAGHMASEQVVRHRTVRRRTLQSVLSFDLFRHQLNETKPDAAFYFTNHVASSMHRYWPATFPGDYQKLRMDGEWTQKFAGEIDYSMGEADRMLQDLLAFVDANPDYVLLVASSMGQAAVDEAERRVATQVLIRDPGKFMRGLGIESGWERRRTMEPAYTFLFDQPAAAREAFEKVRRLRIAGREVDTQLVDERTVEIAFGHANIAEEDFIVLSGNETRDPAEFGLVNERIEDEVGSAAYHVPEGSLLAYDPRSRGRGGRVPGTVPTTRIAPTLLELLDVERPAYMDEPLRELAEVPEAVAA